MSSWEYNEDYRYWSYHAGRAHVTLEPRPAYCDRGRWVAKVFGIGTIDDADAFPRYYMNFERAKLELEEWLAARVTSDARTT